MNQSVTKPQITFSPANNSQLYKKKHIVTMFLHLNMVSEKKQLILLESFK